MVRTTTAGTDIGPQGYLVAVFGLEARPIGVNATVRFEDVPGGSHVVELTEVAENCAVAGGNSREVTVASNGTTDVEFEVTCVARVGVVEVTTVSGGDGLPDSYTLTVNGTISMSIGANAVIAIESLSQGEATAELSVPSNCAVQGDHRRTLLVPFDDVVSTTFEVACGTGGGTLEVVTSTGGGDLDPDGYTVVVDGTIDQGIGVNDAVTFSDLTLGDRIVELRDVAANCAVSGENPRTVGVPFGKTASTTFEVQCDPHGDLQVTTSSMGINIPSVFTVVVNGSSSQAIGPDQTIVFAEVDAGERTVALSDLPAHCEVVNGVNPRTVTVTGGVGTTNFELQCWAWLVFDSDRAGSWDVFIMRHDGADQTNLTSHSADDRQPVLSPDGMRVAFASTRSGTEHIHLMNRDGTNVVQLTTSSRAKEPYWSPDGTRIAFSRRHSSRWDIWVMNADGSNQVNLTDHPADDGRPEWSPDGTRLVFDSDRDGSRGIHVMNGDGSGVTRLTTGDDWNPTWSPDGAKIAFTRFGEGAAGDVWVMNADGSNQLNLTNLSGTLDGEAAWSTDGTTIAFATARHGNTQIYLMEPDGTNLRRLTANLAHDMWPSWSR